MQKCSKMFLNLAVFLILPLGLVIGDYYGRYGSGSSDCVVPSNIVNVTLAHMYRYGGGFIKSYVNFPPSQETDRKCITGYVLKFDGEFMHVLYSSEKITTGELMEKRVIVRQLRPGVFEARSDIPGSTDVAIKYVIAHHPAWTVCTGCLYKDGKFVAQSSSLLSKARILNPLEQLEIYRKAAKIDVQRSMEVGQFYCHYNNDFPDPRPGIY